MWKVVEWLFWTIEHTNRSLDIQCNGFCQAYNDTFVCLTKPVMGEMLHWISSDLLVCLIVQRNHSTIDSACLITSINVKSNSSRYVVFSPPSPSHPQSELYQFKVMNITPNCISAVTSYTTAAHTVCDNICIFRVLFYETTANNHIYCAERSKEGNDMIGI